MAGPQFVEYFGPVLRALENLGGSGRPSEVTEKVAELAGIAADELSAALPSGSSRFANRVAWARFYLARAGLIDASTRGVWRLTDDGRMRAESLTFEDAYRLFLEVHSRFPRATPPQAAVTLDESDAQAPAGFETLAVLASDPTDLLSRLGEVTSREVV